MLPLDKRDLDLVCNATEGHWKMVRNQGIFVTGGTGFFGHWLLESFLAANERFALNARATVLTRDPTTFRRISPHVAAHPAITLLHGDVRNFEFPEGRFSFLIHAAVEGTRRTLEFAVSHGVCRFLMISSGAVYERYPGVPQSAYGLDKRAAEALCASTVGLECMIARPFALVGPHLPLDRNFAIGNFLRDALAAQPIVIRGDPGTTRSYLYAADLAVWLWTILLCGAPLRPYNVGSDQAITMAALAEEVASVVCPGLPVVCVQTEGARSRYVPTIHRAGEELGLRQTIFLREAISRTAAWHQTGH